MLAVIAIGLTMTAEAAAAGDVVGARMSLAHVRELANRPALAHLRPSLTLLAGTLNGSLPLDGKWQAAVEAVWRAVETMAPVPHATYPTSLPGPN